ncbi:MAG: hypothetical protein IJM39_05910 [Firmicutes bacterium]|nr:hypothetical protein [Bacillota bacterium]
MKKKHNQKRIDIIISIVVAVILWIYVINIVNPPTSATFRNVPVTITGEEQLNSSGRALAIKEAYTATVDVSGSRNDMKKISGTDIALSIDVSNLAAGSNSVTVNAVMPTGIKLENIENKTVTVNVEEYVTEAKPVEVVLSGAGSGEEATILRSSLTQIGVSGAQSVVDKVAHVRVSGDLSKADLDKEVELTLAGEAVDASGKVVPGVKLAQESINVNAVMYQTKSVPLSVPVTGSIWEGAALSESRIPDSITIKGPASRLSQISEIKTKELKIDGLYETTVMEIEPVLGDDVYEVDSAEPLQAMFVIAENGRLIYSYKASAVIAKNLAEGTTASFALPDGHKEISAVITGPVSTLRTLAAGDVAPTADAAKREAGEYSVLLTPSRTVTGLSINFAPGSITMKIK